MDGPGLDGFEYRGTGLPDGTGAEPGSDGGKGASPRVRWRVGLRVAALLAAAAVAAGAWFWGGSDAGITICTPVNVQSFTAAS